MSGGDGQRTQGSYEIACNEDIMEIDWGECCGLVCGLRSKTLLHRECEICRRVNMIDSLEWRQRVCARKHG